MEGESLNVHLAFWQVPSENIFFNGLAGFNGAQLEASAILVQSSISLLHPEFDIRSYVLSLQPLSTKLIFFTPISPDGYSLPLFPLSGSGQSFSFFSPFLWQFFRTTISFTRSQSANSCWLHSDLDLLLRPRGIALDSYSSLNDYSLAAC